MNDRAKRALNDLYFFLSKDGYWGLDLEEQPHREMVNIIQTAELDDSTPYSMSIVPRATFKSSISVGAMGWKQLRHIYLFHNPYHRIMFASETLSLCLRALGVLEGQFKMGGYDGRITRDFGPQWVNATRTQRGSRMTMNRDGGDGIRLRARVEAGDKPSIPEPNFWISSEKRPNTGWHCDEHSFDDLMGEKSCKTPTQREKMKDFFKLMFPIINPKDLTGRPSRISLNATRWHDDDVPGYVLQMIEDKTKEDPSYKSKWLILSRGCHTDVGAEEGPLYFPTRLTEKYLQDQRDIMGEYLFSCNYLNDPVGKKGLIHEELIKFVPRGGFPLQFRDLRCAVDPNQHKKSMSLGCWNAGCVGFFDKYANMYIPHAFGGRDWGPVQLIDSLFVVDDLYPGILFLIEDEHATYLEHAIRLTEANKNHRLNVRWISVPRSQSKEDRWQSLIPRFQHGQIFFAEEIDPRIKREIKSELVRGIASRYTDFLDALAMVQNSVRPRVDREPVQQQTQTRPEGMNFQHLMSPADVKRLEEARRFEESHG